MLAITIVIVLGVLGVAAFFYFGHKKQLPAVLQTLENSVESHNKNHLAVVTAILDKIPTAPAPSTPSTSTPSTPSTSTAPTPSTAPATTVSSNTGLTVGHCMQKSAFLM